MGIVKSVTSPGGVRFGTNLDRGKLLLRSDRGNLIRGLNVLTRLRGMPMRIFCKKKKTVYVIETSVTSTCNRKKDVVKIPFRQT